MPLLRNCSCVALCCRKCQLPLGEQRAIRDLFRARSPLRGSAGHPRSLVAGRWRLGIDNVLYHSLSGSGEKGYSIVPGKPAARFRAIPGGCSLNDYSSPRILDESCRYRYGYVELLSRGIQHRFFHFSMSSALALLITTTTLSSGSVRA